MIKLPSSEITDEHLYFSRRKFLAGVGVLLASALVPSACKKLDSQLTDQDTGFCSLAQASATMDELGAKLTSCGDITNYNNFYEFSLEKEDVAVLSRGFRTSPWTIKLGGLVNKPKTFDIDELTPCAYFSVTLALHKKCL